MRIFWSIKNLRKGAQSFWNYSVHQKDVKEQENSLCSTSFHILNPNDIPKTLLVKKYFWSRLWDATFEESNSSEGCTFLFSAMRKIFKLIHEKSSSTWCVYMLICSQIYIVVVSFVKFSYNITRRNRNKWCPLTTALWCDWSGI